MAYYSFINSNILNMKINKVGIDLIKKYEGFESKMYCDIAGYATIGYGHLIIINNGDFFKDGKITKKDAEILLIKDLGSAEKSVNDLVKVNLNDNQFSALVSFVFNLGGAALKRSKLLKKVNKKLFLKCPKEFIKWIYAGKKKYRGLMKRRLEEAFLFVN